MAALLGPRSDRDSRCRCPIVPSLDRTTHRAAGLHEACPSRNDGHLGLRLGDPATVIVEDVVIGNPDGFAQDEEPFARIPRLTVRIDAAASVLSRTLVIASAEIDRPAVRAIATEDGRENYCLPRTSLPGRHACRFRGHLRNGTRDRKG
jgi:hypothetical protein